MKYADIQGELNTQWNAGVIAKPTMYDKQRRDVVLYPNTLFIEIMPSKLEVKSAQNKAYIKKTTFLIKIIANTLSDLEKFRREIGRIITSKSVSGGTWGIESILEPEPTAKRFNQTIIGKERIFTRYDEL